MGPHDLGRGLAPSAWGKIGCCARCGLRLALALDAAPPIRNYSLRPEQAGWACRRYRTAHELSKEGATRNPPRRSWDFAAVSAADRNPQFRRGSGRKDQLCLEARAQSVRAWNPELSTGFCFFGALCGARQRNRCRLANVHGRYAQPAVRARPGKPSNDGCVPKMPSWNTCAPLQPITRGRPPGVE